MKYFAVSTIFPKNEPGRCNGQEKEIRRRLGLEVDWKCFLFNV